MPSWLKKLLQTSSGSSDKVLGVYYDDEGKQTLIGNLTYENEGYIFRYATDCPQELRIKGIDANENATKHLHPFFAARLPSQSRPEILEKMNIIASTDPIVILGELSSKSSISPYVFKLETRKTAKIA